MQNHTINMHIALLRSALRQEQLLMIEEEGVAIEAGKMTIILKKQQQCKGFVKRMYQLSSKIPSSHHEVSLHVQRDSAQDAYNDTNSSSHSPLLHTG